MNTEISTADLRRAIALRERIDALQSELSSILGGGGGSTPRRRGRGRGRGRPAGTSTAATAAAPAKTKRGRRRKKRVLSPEARARIVAAVKARWERERAKKGK